MKGSPEAPQCGFSAKVVAALRAAGASKFAHFDILTDDGVRQGMKEFSQWPTFPQLYAGGELVGGCDIVLELAEAGELAAELARAGGSGAAASAEDPKAAARARLEALTRREPVVLFMKGALAVAGLGV
jgi:Grx4 family monothiol glutaredoxin